MNPAEPAALSVLDRSLGEVIELAKRACFAEMPARADLLTANAAALAGIERELPSSGPRAEAARDACQRVRRKLFLLAELFRQAAAVQSGLLGLHQTTTTPYASSGRLPADRNPLALSRRVDQEA